MYIWGKRLPNLYQISVLWVAWFSHYFTNIFMPEVAAIWKVNRNRLRRTHREPHFKSINRKGICAARVSKLNIKQWLKSTDDNNTGGKRWT